MLFASIMMGVTACHSFSTGPEEPQAFREMLPVRQRLPVVISSPHSGTYYPEALLAMLSVDRSALRCLEDGPIDLLARDCVGEGVPVVAATYARAFVDLNREASELDPDLLVQPEVPANIRISAKVRAGLGVLPNRLAGRAIYRRRLRLEEVEERLESGYRPYHRRLGQLLGEARQCCGVGLLVDCHSMPSEAARSRSARPVDIALGDRFGRSCGKSIGDAAARFLAAKGFVVARNRPYAGGFITECYGRPAEGLHALQLEFRRSLFMDEVTGLPHAGLDGLRSLLGELADVLAGAVRSVAVSPAA